MLLYFGIAIVLGASLVLAPLVTLAGIKPEDQFSRLNSIPEQIKELESPTGLDRSTDSTDAVGVFAISFIIASLVYLLLKPRTPRYDYRWIKPYP